VFGPSYFMDVAQVLAAAAGGPPDLAALGETMRRHGLTPRNQSRPDSSKSSSTEAPERRSRTKRASSRSSHSLAQRTISGRLA